jgi:putative spermidine/putrescine transport system permease protein
MSTFAKDARESLATALRRPFAMAATRENRQHIMTFLLLLPGLAVFFGLFFYPMMVAVVRSFRPEGQTIGWTLSNYAAFLRDASFQKVVLLTLFLAVASTLLSVVLSVPLALLVRRKLAGHRLFRLAILIPITVPSLIGALGLLLFWGSRGWFNLLLTQVFQLSAPLTINYTLGGLVIFYVWHYFPYTAITTLSALEGLDPGFEEAARVAGANPFQVLRHVVIPLIMPGILSGSVLTFMAAFGAFSIPLITGGDYRPLAVSIYKQIDVFTPARWSAASAMAVMMAVLQVIFLTFYMRILRRPAAS